MFLAQGADPDHCDVEFGGHVPNWD
jgi:hypothetical protein